MYKVNKKTKALFEACPIDDDEGLAVQLAGHTSKDPVAFFATCLELEECALMTPTPGRRGSGGGGIQSLLAAVEIERGNAACEKTLILEVHLGIVAGTHGHEEATPTQIVLRVDAYGNAFEHDVSGWTSSCPTGTSTKNSTRQRKQKSKLSYSTEFKSSRSSRNHQCYSMAMATSELKL